MKYEFSTCNGASHEHETQSMSFSVFDVFKPVSKISLLKSKNREE